MSQPSLGRTVSLLLFVWVALMGCGSDSSGPGKDAGPSDFSGLWSLQLEVIAKRSCGNGIGETFSLDASITQEDDAAFLVIEDVQAALTVDGSKATGSTSTGGFDYDFALSRTGNALGGTMTVGDASVPCTEVYEVTGTLLLAGDSCLLTSGCKFAPANGQANDHFGGSVAISGNGIAISTPSKGRAFAYRFDGESIVLERELMPAAGGSFAIPRVAMSGETIVVGAMDASDQALRAGAVHVFQRNGGAWGESQVLRASDQAEDRRFGRSVDVDGDVIVVGAFDDINFPFTDTGTIYVFRFNGSQYVEEQKIVSPDFVEGDFFSTAAVDGDRLVAGSGVLDAAYVFRFNGASWGLEQKLTPLDTPLSFGARVAIQGDIVLVGDPQNTLKGAVYVFRYSGAQWVQEHKRVSPATRSSFDYFGDTVIVDGDRFVVGEGPTGGETAAAYVYRFNGVDWNEETILKASDAGGEDSISPVALSGDFVVGGAWQDDANGVNSGAAYLFRLLGP